MRHEEGEFRNLTPSSSADEVRPARRGRPGARVEVEGHGLGPRGVGEMLDLALDIFRARFGVCVGLSTLFWIPVRFAQPFIGLHRWARAGVPDPSLGFVASFFFNMLATWVVSALVHALMAMLVAAHLQGRQLSLGDAIQRAIERSFALLAIAFLGGILTSAGFLCVCLLCIPGIYFAYKLYVSPVVCVVEGVGVAESLSRSFELARERVIPWLGLAAVTLLLTLPFGSLSAVADDLSLRELLMQKFGVSESVFDWAAAPFTALFMGFSTALQGVVATVWYFDLRARREGTDLDARLELLRGASATREAAT